MRNDFFLCCLWHTVPGDKTEERTLIRRKPGSDMALNNPRNRFRNVQAPAGLCPGLGMTDCMGLPAPNIMKHGAGLNNRQVHQRAIPG